MAFRVQNQIRQNASDIRNYLDDLFSWEEEVNSKGIKPTKSTTAKKDNKENFPIRGQALEEEVVETGNKEENVTEPRPDNEENKDGQTMRRDGTSIPDYYRAWDNYDADKEEQKLDVAIQKQLGTQTQKKPPQQPANPMQQTSGAERNMKIVVKGGRSSYNEVESLKEKGNLFFKSLEFSKAIDMYTECLMKGEEQKVNKELLTVVYSNRAMTYLKLREHRKAEEDCTKALALNDKHVKSLVRRGQARRRLEKHKEALKDFQAASEVEPGNKEIQDELKITLKKIETIKEEQKKKMVLPISLTERTKVSVKVVDYDPEKPEEEKPVESEKKRSPPQRVHVEEKKEATTEKSNNVSQSGEVVSEFITLKDVEGPVVHHTEHAANEEESLKQKVHFRLDLNSVDKTSEKAEYQNDQLEKKPKKSAMKKRDRGGAKENVEEKPKKKVMNVQDLKTSEAVIQGKEVWQKQVIEEFEKAEKAKTGEKAEEPAKPAALISSSEFLNTWKHIKDSQEACEKFLMAQGSPDKFKDIFKVGVDFDYWMELIKFGKGLLERNKKLAFDIMEGLSTVKRFDINVKSMIGSEKKVVREVIEQLNGAEGVSKEAVDHLLQKYKV